jgi:hypothetical protein
MTLTPVSLPQTTLVYQTALAALRSGISCIPIASDGTKRPLIKWKDYQKRHPTLREVRQWFYHKPCGIAFIMGAVSGGLEMLDFDSPCMYEQFALRMQQEGLAWLLESIEGYKELSPKGVHLYYRCPSFLEGNKKLAQRPLHEPPYVLSLIETRGEGGYSIGAPSSGGVHPSRQPYQVACGSLDTIQTIRSEDRALLLSLARTFDEMPKKSAQEIFRNPQKNDGERLPGHIFNECGPAWAEILEPHGWTLVKSIGDEEFWRRPGKETGISATTNYAGSNYLYVFSTSTIFEPCVGISKFAAYTFLEHAGDFSEATRDLVAQGYVERNGRPPARS